ncbi:MAG: hypothetical protein ACTSUL_00145 [Promethearchaeota archaeon]
MNFKESFDEVALRLSAWWDHEKTDRPVISYYHPKKGSSLGGYLDAMGEDWTLAKNHDGIEQALESFEKRAEKTLYGGESVPSYFTNYGAGIIAAIFGSEPKFESETVWFQKISNPKDIVNLLENVKLNQNNEWFSRLLKVTQFAAKRAKDRYQISITDLGGVLDVLSSLISPTEVILTMKRAPHIIDTCRQIILEKLLKIFDELYKIMKKYCNGFNTWLNIWCEKSWYPVQCDFISMLNPKWFERFVLPYIITQMQHMDYSIYHVDGPYQIPFLDHFLSIDELTGIQWVPGAGKPPQGSEEWLHLYKKIQDAGKSVIIDTLPDNISYLYKVLDPMKIYARTYFTSETIANLYLPSFIGGQEGKLIDKIFKWVSSQGKQRLNKDDLEEFLIKYDLKFNTKAKREILKKINSKFKKKLFFT